MKILVLSQSKHNHRQLKVHGNPQSQCGHLKDPESPYFVFFAYIIFLVSSRYKHKIRNVFTGILDLRKENQNSSSRNTTPKTTC